MQVEIFFYRLHRQDLNMKSTFVSKRFLDPSSLKDIFPFYEWKEEFTFLHLINNLDCF